MDTPEIFEDLEAWNMPSEPAAEKTAGWSTLVRSAELHSAVSPNCIRQSARYTESRPNWRNAMQVANLRYGRVNLRTTSDLLLDNNFISQEEQSVLKQRCINTGKLVSGLIRSVEKRQ